MCQLEDVDRQIELTKEFISNVTTVETTVIIFSQFR